MDVAVKVGSTAEFYIEVEGGTEPKTTYYVRVRTYKTVNGVKYYSGWTTVKSEKTK